MAQAAVVTRGRGGRQAAGSARKRDDRSASVRASRRSAAFRARERLRTPAERLAARGGFAKINRTQRRANSRNATLQAARAVIRGDGTVKQRAAQHGVTERQIKLAITRIRRDR